MSPFMGVRLERAEREAFPLAHSLLFRKGLLTVQDAGEPSAAVPSCRIPPQPHKGSKLTHFSVRNLRFREGE